MRSGGSDHAIMRIARTDHANNLKTVICLKISKLNSSVT